MGMTTRQERSALANCAQELPAAFPPKVKGKPQPLTQIVEPFVEKRFKDDDGFRACGKSINAENSPNGRVCFDDRDMAAAIKADGMEAGVQRIIDATMAALSTAVKRVMTSRGVGRRQRIAEAKQALLLSSQPAE
jgi:hypothetical protein